MSIFGFVSVPFWLQIILRYYKLSMLYTTLYFMINPQYLCSNGIPTVYHIGTLAYWGVYHEYSHIKFCTLSVLHNFYWSLAHTWTPFPAKVSINTLSCQGVPREVLPYISVCTFSFYFHYFFWILMLHYMHTLLFSQLSFLCYTILIFTFTKPKIETFVSILTNASLWTWDLNPMTYISYTITWNFNTKVLITMLENPSQENSYCVTKSNQSEPITSFNSKLACDSLFSAVT